MDTHSRLISWVIVGGESGPGARPCDVGWIRDIVGQCRAAGVAFWAKQGPGYKSEMPFGDAELDGVRELPGVGS